MLLDPKAATGLVNNLPSGLVMVLAGSCGELEGLYSIPDLSGCVSAAMSVTTAGVNQVVAHLLIGFSTEAEAGVAVPVVRDGIVNSGLQLREVAIRQEGVLVRVRATGDVEEILPALGE